MAEAKPTSKPPRQKANAAPAKSARGGKAGKDKDDKGQAGPSWWESSAQFLREVKTELKKVTWPPRRQTISSTGVVLILVALVSVFLGLVDFVLARLVRVLIG